MKNKTLPIILCLAAILRLALLVSAWNRPEGFSTPDSEDYKTLAQSLVQHLDFQHDSQPEIFRTPGYPLFLSMGFLLGWKFVIVVQVLLDVLVVYLTYRLGTLLCRRRVGLWAAAFQAVSLVAMVSSVRLLSDGLFTLLALLAIVLLAFYFRSGRFWALPCAAVTAGVACYVRPIGLLFGLVAILVLVFRRRQRLRGTATFAALFVACVLPWIVRNACRAGYPAFSSVGAVNLYAYEAPATLAGAEGISLVRAQEQLAAELTKAPPGEQARRMQAVALGVILEHPWTWVKVHTITSLASFLPAVTDVLEVLGVTTGGRGTLGVLHEQGPSAAMRHYFGGATWAVGLCLPAVILLAVQYLLVAAAAIKYLRPGTDAAAWLILLTILVTCLAGGPASTPRFRVPAAPLLSLAAAAGLVALASLLKKAGMQGIQGIKKPKTT